MSIVFIAPGLYPCGIGGMEIFNYHLLNELSLNNEICLLTTCKKFDNPRIETKYENPRLFLIKRFGIWKIAIVIQNIINIYKYADLKLVILSYTANSEYLSLYIPLLKKIKGFEYIIVNHGGGLKDWKYKRKTKKLFFNAKYNIAVSKAIQDDYRERINRKVIYIPPMVPFKTAVSNPEELKKKYNLHSKSIIIFSVGSLKSIKNPIVLLEAFLSLDKDFIIKNRLVLMFIGDGPMFSKMESIIHDNFCNKYVKLVGAVENERVPDYYNIGDIFVINSKYEGTPISLLEAMFHKKLIIASNSRGINSIINNTNGILYEYDNTGNLTTVIRDTITNKDRLNYLNRNAYDDYKKRFDYKSTLKSFQDIINDVLSK